MHVTRRGVAYQLWSAIEDERLTRAWTGVKVAEEIGLPRGTINRLRDSSRPPTVATVHTIADALARLGVQIDGEPITRKRAEELAGLRPLSPGSPGHVSVRDAILADPDYTDEERETMLRLVDLIHRARRTGRAQPGDGRQSA